MNKTIWALAAGILILGTAGIGLAAEEEDLVANCEVVSIEGKKVVLKCGKDASVLNVGSPVQVVPQKKRTNIEGC